MSQPNRSFRPLMKQVLKIHHFEDMPELFFLSANAANNRAAVSQSLVASFRHCSGSLWKEENSVWFAQFAEKVARQDE